ncbi:MAG: hypothetical protein WEE89_16675 [Gemmatimonadota bacterium]
MLTQLAFIGSIAGSAMSADSCASTRALIRQELDRAVIPALPVLTVSSPHFVHGFAQPVNVCVTRLPHLRSAGLVTGLRMAQLNVSTAYNSAYPRTANDGLLWAGVGASFHVRAGLEYRVRD